MSAGSRSVRRSGSGGAARTAGWRGVSQHGSRPRPDGGIDRDECASTRAPWIDVTKKLPVEVYETELARLQVELVKMQEWVRATGARIAVFFEGRDAAGKGGTITRIMQYLNPPPSYGSSLSPSRPSASRRSGTSGATWPICRPPSEIVLFDRSWYNRAGVEHVMGFCSDEVHARFLRQCPCSSACSLTTASCW